jgi:Holliday junction resolvase-like predicted endonuclease
MLDENEVIEAVCEHLNAEGWTIVQKCSTHERGIDIIARNSESGKHLFIEAKGATSSKPGSKRYDLGFNKNQVFDRVAKGFYTGVCTCACAGRSPQDTIALAFPDTVAFRNRLDPLRTAVHLLGMKIYLVREDRSVATL